MAMHEPDSSTGIEDVLAALGQIETEDLAAALGRRQAYVSKYELGERRLDLLELIAICDATGITLTDFSRRFDTARSAAANG